MTTAINNNWDVIDSRDILARIDDLRSMLPQEAGDVMPGTAGELADIAAELATLEELAKQGEAYAVDWEYGETLIHDSYFAKYAEDLANDCGLEAPKDHRGNVAWPFNCIDWDEAAEQLKNNYTAIDFDGETYWIR